MKELKIIEQTKTIKRTYSLNEIEMKFHINIPDFLKIFLIKYDNSIVEETYYMKEPSFKEIISLELLDSILEGHDYYGIIGYIPFAIDGGGWDYNVSITPETYGQVWVNEFDSGEENTMKFVANSFEDFINGLESELDVLKQQGYSDETLRSLGYKI